MSVEAGGSSVGGVPRIVAMLHRNLFASGFTKAQEGAERFVRGELWRRTVGTLLRL